MITLPAERVPCILVIKLFNQIILSALCVFLTLHRYSTSIILHFYFYIYFLYFTAITIGVRILGPALGFILGSLCTMLYADLSANPQITPSDPRWVGAWWLGKFFFLSFPFPFFFFSSKISSYLIISIIYKLK